MVDNLEELRWNHLDLAITAANHLYTLRMYREELVRPSLRSLDEKIEALARSGDPVDAFAHDDFADLHHATVEGFLLTTQSMWERGLRGMMVAVATREKPELAVAVKKALWAPGKPDGIQAHFNALFGASLEWFGCPQDLTVLQTLGNALRHGDGRSAELLHDLCPSLWTQWLPPGAAFQIGDREYRVPDHAPRHPSFDHITLPGDLLEQMMLTVQWFWEDIEFVRCNSFMRKAGSVVRMLEDLRTSRRDRAQQRHWTPK